MAPLVELQDLSKVYGSGEAEVRALDGLDLTIGRGEFVAVMGPSGSGKSTAMNIVGYLDTPSSGRYLFDGVPVEKASRNQRTALRRNFIGVNKQQVRDFDRAGERSYQLGARYDFGTIGLPGTFFLANVTYGGNAINANTGASLPDVYEYDLELNFRAERLEVPEWLKPLQLRARLAFIDQYAPSTLVQSTTEYRVILNYEVSWQGPRRR